MIGAMIYTKQRAYFEILLLSPLGNRTYFTGLVKWYLCDQINNLLRTRPRIFSRRTNLSPSCRSFSKFILSNCNYRKVSSVRAPKLSFPIETYLLSVKIPNDGGLTRFALDFDLLKDLHISSNLWCVLWLIQDNELRSLRTFIIHS